MQYCFCYHGPHLFLNEDEMMAFVRLGGVLGFTGVGFDNNPEDAALLPRPVTEAVRQELRCREAVARTTLACHAAITFAVLLTNIPPNFFTFAVSVMLMFMGGSQLCIVARQIPLLEEGDAIGRNFYSHANTFISASAGLMTLLIAAAMNDLSEDNPSQIFQILSFFPAFFMLSSLFSTARTLRTLCAAREAHVPAPVSVSVFPHADTFYTLPNRAEAAALFDFIQQRMQNMEHFIAILTPEERALLVKEGLLSLEACPLFFDLPAEQAAAVWALDLGPDGKPISMGPPPMGHTFDASALLRAYETGRTQRAALPRRARHDDNLQARHPVTGEVYTAEQVRGPHEEWIRLYAAFAQVACREDVQALIRGSSTALAAHVMAGGAVAAAVVADGPELV